MLHLPRVIVPGLKKPLRCFDIFFFFWKKIGSDHNFGITLTRAGTKTIVTQCSGALIPRQEEDTLIRTQNWDII